MAFGSAWLTPRMREFLDLYPEIEVSFVVDDSELDLSMREADVAIRMSPPRQPDLVQRHLMTVPHHVSMPRADYLKKHGTPQKAEDLDKHRLIVYGERRAPAGAQRQLAARRPARKPGSERRPILAVNNLYAHAAARSRAASASPRCPISWQRRDARFWCACCPSCRRPEVEAYFVYPEELRTSKRIAVFRDFLLRKVAERNGSTPTPAR